MASSVPRLNTIRFFLWVYMKNLVYQVKINRVQDLQNHIRDAFAVVIPNMLQASWNEVEYHLDIYHQGRSIKYMRYEIHRKKLA